jgi:hypothetical protein
VEQGFLRSVNEQIHALLVAVGLPGDYICECERLRCDEPWVPIPPDEFTVVLRTPGSYVVAPGHQPPDAEVIWEGDGYLVIREHEPEPPERRTRARLRGNPILRLPNGRRQGRASRAEAVSAR